MTPKPRAVTGSASTESPSASTGGLYFGSPTPVSSLPTGCKMLDLALGGGGWAEGRMINVIGDKSTGKTLLAIEASANFIRKHPRGRVRYVESESAFDSAYAEALGFPLSSVDFVQARVVEDVHKDLQSLIESRKDKSGKSRNDIEPILYVVDSLDALSDNAEQERDVDATNTFGTKKAQKLGQMFRDVIQDCEDQNITLFLISQERDNVGVTFGKQSTRSGGRSLDFYASQVCWLYPQGKIERTIQSVKRIIGVKVRAVIEKNKVGLPWREAKFSILFGFGIDEIEAALNWIKEIKCPEIIGCTEAEVDRHIKSLDSISAAEYQELRTLLYKVVTEKWFEIEKGFLPTRKKYT